MIRNLTLAFAVALSGALWYLVFWLLHAWQVRQIESVLDHPGASIWAYGEAVDRLLFTRRGRNVCFWIVMLALFSVIGLLS